MKHRIALVFLIVASTVLAAPGANASFPGDNGKIAFYDFLQFFGRGEPNQIYAIDPDGTGRTQLTTGERSATDPAWSADGTRIAFASNRTARRPRGRIEIIDADGQNRTVVVRMRPRVTTTDPAWSPDGSQIAFCRHRLRGVAAIFVVDVDGTDLLRVSDPHEDQCSPDWSPDGTMLAYTSNLPNGATQLGLEVPMPSADRTILVARGSNNWPSWSPDGSSIAFSKLRRDADQRDIFVVDVDTGDVTQITETAKWEWTPAWSPDGTRIAFGRSIGFNQSDIWTVATDGSDPLRLTDTPKRDEFQLNWRPIAP